MFFLFIMTLVCNKRFNWMGCA